MKILVLNCGSSSVKFQLIETGLEEIARNQDRIVVRGLVEKIGSPDSIVSCTIREHSLRYNKPISSHKEALSTVFDSMTGRPEVLTGPEEIGGVGHRIVHGGEGLTRSALMEPSTIEKIEHAVELAPLHNSHNLEGFYAARELLPKAVHVAVFDTSFHHTLPPRAYLYGLPYDLYERHRVRRYGFHGTSHRYVSQRFAEIHGAPAERYKLITCHLGNGCSVCAVDRGRSADTSMGFTPLEGLLMGTRSGDLDPGALLYLMSKARLGIKDANHLLNEESGLYGLSGLSRDMRELLSQREKGKERAGLAIDTFCYRVKKYIGAYFAVLNGADAVIFTGGIGENAPSLRAQICESLGALGISLNTERNQAAVGVETDITADDARTKVWVIPTNEELLIARDTLACILSS